MKRSPTKAESELILDAQELGVDGRELDLQAPKSDLKSSNLDVESSKVEVASAPAIPPEVKDPGHKSTQSRDGGDSVQTVSAFVQDNAAQDPKAAQTQTAQTNEPARAVKTTRPAKPDRFFPLSQRFPLQVFEDETSLQKLSHWGPMITSVASIVLTLFVWLSAKQLNEQQIDLQKKQTQLQSEQVKAELADIRFKFLNDLVQTDEDKALPAEIGLAAHGRDALPVVYFALGVDRENMRESAVNVFNRMFQAAATFEERKQLLADLMAQMQSPNKTLHLGIVQALVKIGPLLGAEERQSVIAFLQKDVQPAIVCSDTVGRGTVKEAATFFWSRDANSIPYLLTVARTPKCGDGWLQAMIKLSEVAANQPQKRAELQTATAQVRTEVLNGLRENVSDDDFVNGGFGGFLPEGKLVVSFEDFKQRIEEEFNSLGGNSGKQLSWALQQGLMVLSSTPSVGSSLARTF